MALDATLSRWGIHNDPPQLRGHTIYLTYIAVSISLLSCIQWREPALFPPLQGACVQTLAADDAH